MKTLDQLRADFNRMNEQEITRELLITQVRSARALENQAFYLGKIFENTEKFRLY